MLGAFGCTLLGVVGSNLTVAKFEPATSNMPQHIGGGRTRNMLRLAVLMGAPDCICAMRGSDIRWSSLLENGTTYFFRP